MLIMKVTLMATFVVAKIQKNSCCASLIAKIDIT